MHGNGIRQGTTISSPPARLLELTRVLALQSRRPSGVDRVCLAYLRAVISAPEPCFGLVRTGLGYVLLDETGMETLLACLEGQRAWPKADILSRLRHPSGSPKRVPETLVRALAVGRARPRRLARMLRRHLPAGTTYINVDQTTLTKRVMAAVKTIKGARVAVFLHDTIPLDYPEYQTEASVTKLRFVLAHTAQYADMILTNSQVSKDDIIRHMAPLGPVPPITVAHLGVEVDFFDIVNNQTASEVPSPYFLCLGTIEPRKNVAFLLDLWDALSISLPTQDLPHLVICGRRGWNSEALFARLDSNPLVGDFIHEFNDLSDESLAILLRRAHGLLFPSFAEGFGLPPVEAAALGVPVVCNELPVMREILGDYPIYASVSGVYSWETIVRSLTKTPSTPEGSKSHLKAPFPPPTWEAHFNIVLRVT